MRGHGLVLVTLAGLGLANMWGWLDADRLPPYDFPGYVAVVEDTAEQIRSHGGLPRWNPKWFGGTTAVMSAFKERLILPLALLFDPLRGTQLAVYLFRLAAGLVFYAAFFRYFGAGAVGLACGFAYAFGVPASYSSENVDVMLSYLLFPLIFIAALEAVRRRSVLAALLLGVAVACQFLTNLVQALIAPAMAALIVVFRPWVDAPSHPDYRPGPESWLAWARGLSLALGVFIVFAASQIVWFAADQQHHAAHRPSHVEVMLPHFSEPSPFVLVNRGNWLGDWLVDHRTPYMDHFQDDPLRNQRRYLGVVALCIVGLGWFALRGERQLRRAYQLFALLFLLQWNLGMGLHSLLWQLARSFHLDPAHDLALLELARAAAVGCGVGAWLRWRREGHRLSPGVEVWLGSALVFIALSHPLFASLRSLFSVFAHFRSPGQFMNLLPFSFIGLFGVALLGMTRHWIRARWKTPFALLVLCALVVDAWPGRAAFYRGHSIEDVREFREIAAGLPGAERGERIAFPLFQPASTWVESSLVAVHSPLPVAWGWAPWRASAYARPFLGHAFLWLDGDPPPEEGVQRREIGEVLSRIGRYRYLLDEFRGVPSREMEGSWKLLAHNEQFALWKQARILPRAYGYRDYVVSVGNGYNAYAITIYRAHRRGMAVVAGGDAFGDLDPALVEGSLAVVGLTESALSEAELEKRPDLVQRLGEALLDPTEADFKARFAGFFSSRPVSSLLRVTFRQRAPEHFRLSVDAASEPAVIFVSEAYHPWWRARVDGKSEPVLRAQLMFMAVRVGPGQHEIEMELQPPLGVRLADALSAFAWIALGSVALAAGIRELWRRWRQFAA